MNYGYCTNNSIAIEQPLTDYREIIHKIKNNGEPALVFMDNIRRYGRMQYHADYKDFYRVVGVNPCGESILLSHEACNLSEIFLNRIYTFDEFINVLKYAFLYCKIISTIKTGHTKSDSIIEKNRRVGVSLSGIIQFIDRYSEQILIEWLKAGYEILETYDKFISKVLGINTSIRMTTCKPSGTLSLLAGAIPSITRPYYNKYIRRVRVSRDDPLIEKYSKLGYEIEDDIICKDNKIIKFIVNLGNIKLNSGNIEDDLKLASIIQGYWSDQSLSMTVQFNKDINDDTFNDLIIKYSKKLKTMCFLPMDCKSYPQMPYEEIKDEQYYEEVNNIIKRRKLTDTRFNNWINFENSSNKDIQEDEKHIFCDSEKCINF